MLNEAFVEDMKELEIWSEHLIDEIKRVDGNLEEIPNIPEHIAEKYKTAFQQDQLKLLEAAGSRQRWIDQGQSVNLYNSHTSLKYLNDLYMHAWSCGLKTTYYLRNQAASKIEKSTVSSLEPENITACSLDNGECEACQ